MNFRKFYSILLRFEIHSFILEQALENAKRFDKKYDKINKHKKKETKKTNKQIPDLPQKDELNINNEKYEDNAVKVINVLRQTHADIGIKLKKQRIEAKIEKKMQNVQFLRQTIVKQQKSTLKQKIRQMRKDKIFPIPKSYTNYKKRNGLFSKNSIKIKKS